MESGQAASGARRPPQLQYMGGGLSVLQYEPHYKNTYYNEFREPWHVALLTFFLAERGGG